MRHLAAMTVLIFLALPGTASECPSRGGASPSASAQAEDIPAVHLDRVRGLSVILGRPGDGSPLVRGLTRLATAQPERYALRIGRATHPDWFASGGLSHHQVGSGSKPDKRLEAFSKRIEEFAGKVDVAAVQFSPNDLPSGTRVEVAYRSYAADMDVFVTNVGMNGSFTENILAPRIFNLGNTGVVSPPVPFPIELPNVSVDAVRTHVRVPAGVGLAGEALTTTKWRAVPSTRDPRVAFVNYRDTVSALVARHPSTRMVMTTLPLKISDNAQRNYFNSYVRAQAAAFGLPLFDIAELLSHDPEGRPCADAQGPVMSSAYVVKGQSSTLNEQGEDRLALAWWVLMARLDGWDGRSTTATAAAIGPSAP